MSWYMLWIRDTADGCCICPVKHVEADKDAWAVVLESDCLSEDAHVNKREAYKNKCVVEAQIQLVSVTCGLTP